MESGNHFPWESLKADCLRLVCHQVCASSEVGGFTNSFGKRDEMIGFLRDVTERGLDDALTALGESKQTRKGTQETTSGVKRKTTDEDIDEDQDADDVADVAEAPTTPNPHQAYNTRFKGVKRVKLGREVPEGFPYTPHRRVPRKSAPADLGSGSRTKENGSGGGEVEPLKRPRGRPRKNPQIVATHSSAVAVAPKAVAATPKAGRPPTSAMKQVFDGVVVVKRAHPPSKRAELEDTAASHPDPDADADAEGEMDGDSEEIVAPDHVELNGVAVVGENDRHDSNQGDSSAP